MRSIVDGQERRYELHRGMVGFVPNDHRSHTVVLSTDRPTHSFVLLFPPEAIEELIHAEGIVVDAAECMAFTDPMLHAILARLSEVSRQQNAGDRLLAAELARDAILRAIERLTGRRPAWTVDRRPFDGRTMASITALIDQQLTNPPDLAEVAILTGLSVSHCARKVRITTGMSLSQFCNLRRVQRALVDLRSGGRSMAALALDLGFCSQSHFTRVFSEVTGMTPSRYRRSFPRTVESRVAAGEEGQRAGVTVSARSPLSLPREVDASPAE